MDDSRALQAILSKLEKLNNVEEKLNSMERDIKEINGKIDHLQEDATVTRSEVNTIANWSEEVGNQIKIPLYKD